MFRKPKKYTVFQNNHILFLLPYVMQSDHPMLSASQPADHPPSLEEKVDHLSDQFAHLMEAFVYANQQTQAQAHHDPAEADREVEDFLSHHEDEELKIGRA